MTIKQYLQENYIFEDDAVVDAIPNTDDNSSIMLGNVDNKFIIRLINHLEKLFPQYATLDNDIYNEIRSYIDSSDNKKVIKIKERIHNIVVDERNKLFHRLQHRLGKLQVPIKKGN